MTKTEAFVWVVEQMRKNNGAKPLTTEGRAELINAAVDEDRVLDVIVAARKNGLDAAL